MIDKENFFNKNNILNLEDVSLKLYKDFFEEVLCQRIFIYTTSNTEKINLYFAPNNFMHILGCQHILGNNYKASNFNKNIDNGTMSFEVLKSIDNNKFNDFTNRFINFSNVYHVLTNCDVIYFDKKIYNPKSKVDYKYMLFKDVYSKKIHLGLDTYNKGRSFFCKSLLTTSLGNDKLIKNQLPVPIEKIEVFDKESKTIIEQKVLKDGQYIFIYKDGLYNIGKKELNNMISQHEVWINTNGSHGTQLNLNNTNLQGEKLLNLDLRNSNFTNSDLRKCIIYADLRGANLTGAKIDNTIWLGSNLINIKIEDSKLKIIENQINNNLEKHKYGLKFLKSAQKEIAANKED
ncbi:pentapeptide repeat-containing protein [Clostridium faecium]|uniref:Pentapeptide repeat-containing protein n=1 Tax=Clostridium faecium TaxID=2762223 RepID=A0ABR8YNI0_9CLOT|nr:pentapeptide repeat-containing protein [Clostridium faecium]MBD8045811.1 pentapeptide repeat-containing protein [Clostridium faecium]